ncbi:Uncharacterised protein [Bordetella pertussis]|nr:Uncharacterised protein [Bordetella pertussis]
MASPSWLATQPPTPITRLGFCFLRCCTRPRSENTFSCAFSRTEQVLNRMTSASSGLSVSSRPWSARSTSAILSESYSFIWQPKVRIYNLPRPWAAVAGVPASDGLAPSRLTVVSCMAVAVTGVDPGGVSGRNRPF